jgi:hypothetical protein
VQEFVVGAMPDCVADGVTLIAAGATCTVPITFQPGYPGLRWAPLQVQTSQGNFQFGLVGIGQAPQVVLVPGVISTVAGNGAACYDSAGNDLACYSGDGGPATSAQMYGPAGVAVDMAGDLYIADSYNHVIREVSASTGAISTVAGNGTQGYSGDGGAATSAELNYPSGVALDTAGNLFIGDSGNNLIRRVDATSGLITTVAGIWWNNGYIGDGGVATSAGLNWPVGVALDAAGDLYIADFGHNVIRRVDATTGIITTMVGDGDSNYSGDGGPAASAELAHPNGVAVDLVGDLFIADFGNNAIRKVDGSTGLISTVAGAGSGVVVDAAGDLYVGDQIFNRVFQVDAATGVITNVAGIYGLSGYSGDGGPATSAQFYSPTGVALDPAGNQYIADFENNVIRRVSAGGMLMFSAPGVQTAMVSNTGNALLNISSMVASAGFAIDPGATTCSLSSSLAAGNSCLIGVVQTAGGLPAGTLAITDNALNVSGATQQVQLAGVLSAPAFSPAPGGYSAVQTVTLSSAVPGIAIFYTLDGSIPTTASTLYAGPITVGATTTIQAIAVAAGYPPSPMAAGTYTITIPAAAMPTFSPAPGVYTTAQMISIADSTPGATIYYTTDGSMPTTASAPYAGPLLISGTTTLQAIAVAAGFAPSAVASGTYTNMGPATAVPTSPTSLPATQVGAQSASQTVLVPITASLSISSITVPQSLGGVQEFVVGTVSGCAVDGVTTIAAGTNCTVPVTFQPAYPGLRQQPLVVQTSLGTLQFGLEGMGQAPQVALVPGLITTVAGTGTYFGYSGDGGAATSAWLYYPEAVAVDAAGDQYIADSANSVVREVNAVTGTISTVAGNGNSGYSGDGGPATSATLSYLSAVALDAAGNLYITDPNNCVIREVTAATGVITTVAGNGTQGDSGDGGPATGAQLGVPNGVALDAAGNLYIADSFYPVIREVNAVTGVISTVAGNGATGYMGDGGAAISAELNWPTGIALDAAGNLYIADTNNSVIREVNLATGVITTVAGNGTPGYNGDGGPATSAELSNPQGVVVDAAGNLYLTDEGNGVVREVEAATGTINTIAGNGSSAYFGDGGPATSAAFNAPAGIALDAAGNQYLADGGNSVIREVSISGALNLPTPSPVPATVSNTGNQPLTISAIATSANFATDPGSTTCSLTAPLAAGASCVVGVVYTATAGGSLTGVLTITDNALNMSGATQQMQLTGVAAAPTFSPAPGAYDSPQSVVLSDVTAGVTFYYTTDGTTPTTASTLYTGPIPINATTTLQAIAVANGYSQSAATYGRYTIEVATPYFSPRTGRYAGPLTVTLGDASPNAVLYYTLDGSIPTLASTVYTAPITVNGTTTIKAIAVIPNGAESVIASAIYTIPGPAAPTFSPAAGTYHVPQTVTLNDTSQGVVIYYTTDDTIPTTASTLYTGSITVNTTITIKAIAVGSSGTSSVATGTFTIDLYAAAKPAFSPLGGTYSTAQTVTLTDYTTGAVMYYTTDGSNPTTASTPYTGPVTVNTTTTIKAIAAATNYLPSIVASETYTIEMPVPTFSPAAGTYNAAQTVTLADAFSSAVIYYTTDGSTPTTASTPYTGPIPVSVTTTIKAIATATGCLSSTVVTETYKIELPPLVISPAAGTYSAPQTITLSDVFPGAIIYYTTNDQTPTTSSTLYTGPITIGTNAQKTGVTIKAIATAAGCTQSSMLTAIFTVDWPLVATPSFSLRAGNYRPPQTVTLTDTTPGAVLYYSTDGSTPTTASIPYTGPIAVNFTTTIKAIATESGYWPSAVVSDTYTIIGSPVTAPPSFSPPPGGYLLPQTVTLSDATPGAVIYYTTNGSTPTTASAQYAGPISVSGTTTIRAYAAASGEALSAVTGGAYIIDSPAATPTLSPAPGSYDFPQAVTLNDATSGAVIYYTADGTIPTSASAQYTGPITVSTTTTIQAMAVAGGYLQSAVAAGTFTITGPPVTASPLSLPATPVGAPGVPQSLLLTINSSLTINNLSIPAGPGGVREFVQGTVSGCAVDGVTTITAGSICAVSITFQPAYAGMRQSVLMVQTSLGTFSFDLSGIGQAPQVALVPGVISTVAGNNNNAAGYGGDGAAATAASLNAPMAVAVDESGNLFIADTQNFVVRRVDAVTGTITTVAGNGAAGFSGDGGPAPSAQLSQPEAVALDAAGNLYIADSGNSAIREVAAATGVITTVAGTGGQQGYSGDGGLATAARLSWPSGVAVDTQGNLYIADYENNVIREVNATTGVITTAAGNGTAGYSGDGGAATGAELWEPIAVTLDSQGNLYIADTQNNVIREVNASTGVITTTASNGLDSGELSTPVGVAVDAAGNLYISNFNGFTISKVDAATGVINTIGGNGTSGYTGDDGPATSAELNYQYGIALDAAGNLYIADTGNNVIREVSTSGAVVLPSAGVVGLAAVSNTGTAPLNISAITPSANFATDPGTTTCSLTSPLAVGASCAVGVVYTPVVAGAAGTLTITDNVLNVSGATQQLQLSVTSPALSPILTVSCPEVGYDGNAHTCTGTATGADGGTVAGSFSFSPASETAAGSYPVTATFTSTDPNYVSGTASSTLIIDMIAQSPKIFCPAPLTYDATPHSCTISGGFGSCTSSSVTSVPGSASLALSCAGDGNYQAWSSTGSITINPAPLEAFVTVAGKTYDGTTSASISTCTVAPLLGSDVVTCSAAAVKFTSANVGSQTAMLAGITLGGPAAANYILSFAPATSTATIIQLPVTLTAKGVEYTYGTTPGTISCTVVPNPDGISCSVIVSGSSTVPSATDPNYSFTIVDGTATVDNATPVVTVTCPPALPYDGSAHNCTVDVIGVGNKDITSSGTITWNVASGAPASETAAGTYPMTATFSAPNYNTTSASGTLTINKAAQTITCVTSPAAWQNPWTPCSAYSGSALSGLPVYYTNLSSSTLTPGGTPLGTALIPSKEGIFSFTASQPGNSNYLAAPSVVVSRLTLGNATPTISCTFNGTATNLPSSEVYGSADIAYSCSSSDGSALTAVAIGPVTVTAKSTDTAKGTNYVTTGAIHVTGISTAAGVRFTSPAITDYNTIAATYTMPVTPAPLTITANPYVYIFGGRAPTNASYTYSGLVKGDVLPAGTVTYTVNTIATPGNPSVPVTPSATMAFGEYTIIPATAPPYTTAQQKVLANYILPVGLANGQFTYEPNAAGITVSPATGRLNRFADTPTNATSAATIITITNASGTSMVFTPTLTGSNSNGNYFKVAPLSCKAGITATTKKCVFSVYFTPPTPDSSNELNGAPNPLFTGSLTIATADPNTTDPAVALPTMVWSLSGNEAGAISAVLTNGFGTSTPDLNMTPGLVTVTNNSDYPVTVSSITSTLAKYFVVTTRNDPTNNCLAPATGSTKPAPLSPNGGQCTFPVTFEPVAGGSTSGVYSGTINIAATATDVVGAKTNLTTYALSISATESTWKVSASASTSITGVQDLYTGYLYPTVTNGAAQPFTITRAALSMKAHGVGTYFVVNISATAPVPAGSTSCFNGSVAAQGTCVIPVQFAPVAGMASTTTGKFDDILTITGTVKDQATGAATAVPSFTAGVHGSDVTFTETSSLTAGSFASVVDGASSPGSVTVYNYSLQPLTLKDTYVTSTDTYFAVAAKTAWVGTGCTTGVVAAATSTTNPGQCVIPLTFTPIAGTYYPAGETVGSYSDTLTITGAITPAIGGSPVTVPIQGQPLGAKNSPQMIYRPQPSLGLQFSSTSSGAVTESVTIVNYSNAAQSFISIGTTPNVTVTGPYTVTVPTTCRALAMGGNCKVSVTLPKNASGSGTLTIIDPLIGTMTYALSPAATD